MSLAKERRIKTKQTKEEAGVEDEVWKRMRRKSIERTEGNGARPVVYSTEVTQIDVTRLFLDMKPDPRGQKQTSKPLGYRGTSKVRCAPDFNWGEGVIITPK